MYKRRGGDKFLRIIIQNTEVSNRLKGDKHRKGEYPT